MDGGARTGEKNRENMRIRAKGEGGLGSRERDERVESYFRAKEESAVMRGTRE